MILKSHQNKALNDLKAMEDNLMQKKNKED